MSEDVNQGTGRESRESELYASLMDEVNLEYATMKGRKMDLSYTAPEAMPKIESDQVKAVVRVIARMLAGE